MGDDGRVAGDPTEVLTRSGGSSYVSLTGAATVTDAATAQPATAQPAMAQPATGRPEPAPPVSRAMFIGWLALAAALLAAVLTGVGIAQASDGEFESGAALAWVAIVVSAVAVAGGILAVIARFGRPPGIAAIVLGVLANPYLLARLLDAVGQLSAAAAATT